MTRGAASLRNDGTTVHGLSASALGDRLADHGEAFGGRGTASLDVLQAAANDGEACLIVVKPSAWWQAKQFQALALWRYA